MYSLYLFTACFLPLITFCPSRNNFQIGANLATAQTLVFPVDQPFNDKDKEHVSKYTNDYLERRQNFEIINTSSDRSIYTVGKIGEKRCTATAIDNIGHFLTTRRCVHSGEAPFPNIEFVRREGNNIQHIWVPIDSVITFGESDSPYHDIAVIHIEGYEPRSWMNIKTTGELERAGRRNVDIMGFLPDSFENGMMFQTSAVITQLLSIGVFELRADFGTYGAPVFVAGNHGATIYGVISDVEEMDDDEGNLFHFSVAGITPEKLEQIQKLIGPIPLYQGR